MMIAKTLLGLNFFDEYYGGVYHGRSFLVAGPHGSGKTTLGLQFLRQGLLQDECCLLLSTRPVNNLDIQAAMLGLSLDSHINAGRLTLLEYSGGDDKGGYEMLPPEGFNQLREIINHNMVQRILIDTVVPLVAVSEITRMTEHIYSFLRFFDRLKATTMMTMPRPASPIAIRLKNALEAALPVSITLNPAETEQPAVFNFQVAKYLGAEKLMSPVSYIVKQPTGITKYQPASKPRAPIASAVLKQPSQPESPSAAPSFVVPQANDSNAPSFQPAYSRFSAAVLSGRSQPVSEPRHAEPAQLPQPFNPPQSASNESPQPPPPAPLKSKFSNVWSPVAINDKSKLNQTSKS